MAHVIAVAGKGGVGKTTLCGLLIQYLCESGKGHVLAVDADANSNLNEVLGVEEAGMEHISRGIRPGMDTAILVSDCSRRGVQAAARIAELIKECDMKPKQVGLIVNRAPNGVLNEGTREEIEKQGLTLLGVVPHDDQVYEYDCDGKPTVRLPEDSPVRAALKKIVENLDL